MARDVEFNVTASDRTGNAIASAERKFKESQKRVRKESDDTGKSIGKSLFKGAGDAFPKIASSLKDNFGVAGVSGGQALAAGIAVASPFIGATISAAVIGGAGIGGVIGGVALAARDPRVKSAASRLGETVMSALTADAAPFIDPVLQNITKIEARFQVMNARISNIFKNSAGFLDPLVDGALNGVDGILRGFDALVAHAGPVINALRGAFSDVGDAVGDALETIAGDSDDAATAVDDLSAILQATIRITGGVIRALTELYGALHFLAAPALATYKAFGLVNDEETKTAKASVLMDAAVTGAQKAITGAGGAAKAASGPVASFTDKVNSLTTAGRQLYDSTTDAAAATSNLRDKLKENGRTLDENTAKGRENRTALSQLAGALIAKYNAEVNANGETRRSNQLAGQNRDAFIRLATQFGLTRAAAAKLATQFGLIPSKKNTSFTANTHDAEARAKALQQKINSVHGKSVTIGVNFAFSQSKLNQINNTLDRLGGSGLLSHQSFAQASPESSARARTGGPAPINVTSEVSVLLDGVPFYAKAVRAADAESRRSAFRAKVGKR